MGKVIVSEFITADGVIENPEWSMKYWNDEIAAFKAAEMAACGALLLGRKTYEGFAAVWPTHPERHGYPINERPKYVATRTLTELTWNAKALPADLAAGVRQAKAEVEGNLLVFGSADLVGSLLELGLVDELHLLTYPVVRGQGQRLFPDRFSGTLERLEVQPITGGPLLLKYRPLAR